MTIDSELTQPWRKPVYDYENLEEDKPELQLTSWNIEM